MVELRVSIKDRVCHCSVKSPLRKALVEITIGVLALLDSMSGGDSRVKEVLLNTLIDTLEEHKNQKFIYKEDTK